MIQYLWHVCRCNLLKFQQQSRFPESRVYFLGRGVDLCCWNFVPVQVRDNCQVCTRFGGNDNYFVEAGHNPVTYSWADCVWEPGTKRCAIGKGRFPGSPGLFPKSPRSCPGLDETRKRVAYLQSCWPGLRKSLGPLEGLNEFENIPCKWWWEFFRGEGEMAN